MTCETLCDTPFETCVEQGGTFEYSAVLKDEDGVEVPLASLTSLTLRLTNQADGEVINDRDDEDVKNVNGGTYHATSGALTMRFSADDNPITEDGAEKRRETHVAMFTATWATGSKRWPVLITVDNLDKLAGSAA